VRETLQILQKVFMIRQCEDSFYANRTRPCLQYQIKRCSAPCVGFISPKDYQQDVEHAVLFLEGKSQLLINDLAVKMDSASQALDFEQAVIYRDQIQKLSLIREQQYVVNDSGNVDIIACVVKPGGICVQILYVRDGRVLGNKTYFPPSPLDIDAAQVLSEFIPQFYLNSMGVRDIPPDILTNVAVEDAATIMAALTASSSRKTSISHKVRTHRARWLKLAVTNAQQNLVNHLASKQQFYSRFEALQQEFSLDAIPQRLECFDISHSSGEATVASCVVFDVNGPLKNDYRRFNIEGITEGDDYAAMRQALLRRYTRVKSGEAKAPDILFIDGGKGQLHQAEMVLAELEITNIILIAIAKGAGRKPGLETLIVSGQFGEINLPPDSLALHLIQQIRDEAHRFAIIGHRGRRAKKRSESPLEKIPGVGPKRRRDLLRHFGGWQEIMRASAEELGKVNGIGSYKAQEIYAYLHNE
jgi:excinuclease ABC subunit C